MKRSLWILSFGLVLALVASTGWSAEAKKPAVLFTSGLHNTYFTRPLYAEGVEIHTCAATNLPALLPGGKYNVVVVTGGMTEPAVVAALRSFLDAGGGVLMYPGCRWEEA